MEAERGARRAGIRALNSAFYRGNRGLIGLCLMTSVVESGLNLAVAYLLQVMIDVATGGAPEQLEWVAALSAGIVAVLVTGALISCYAFPRMMERASKQYKNHVFKMLTRKSISSFSSESSSRYISALTNDVTAIENGWLSQVPGLVQQVLTCVGALVKMVWYSPVLTLWALGLSLLPLVASLMTGNVLSRREKQVSDGNERFLAMVKDMLTGFPVVKSFQAEEQVTALFEGENDALEVTKRHRRRAASLIDMLTGLAGLVCQLGVFLVACWMALTGQGVTVGMVMAFVQMMNYIMQPMSTVPQIYAGYKAKNALVEKLADAMAENVERGGESIPPTLREGIQLQDVTFGYDPQKPVLRHVSCDVKAGTSCAVVGASGSGKSTLLNLLMGGYDGYEGSILLDGHELRGVSTDSLYAMMSLVQQNVFVFNDTLRRNITMFRDLPEAEVLDAARRSGLSGVIGAKGLDYRCGENGCGLSGGEKQRVSIARGLLRHASVLLMDEATAALDNQTAQEVTDAVLSLEGITRLVVTHRLNAGTLRRYDTILVMRGGTICERGTFEELMAQKGYFYSLYTVAQSGDAD